MSHTLYWIESKAAALSKCVITLKSSKPNRAVRQLDIALNTYNQARNTASRANGHYTENIQDKGTWSYERHTSLWTVCWRTSSAGSSETRRETASVTSSVLKETLATNSKATRPNLNLFEICHHGCRESCLVIMAVKPEKRSLVQSDA